MRTTFRPANATPAAQLLATAGDGEAFEHLAAPHRRELSVHRHRGKGSVDDAEVAVQETLLARRPG